MNHFFSLNSLPVSPISLFFREIKWRIFYCFLSLITTFSCCYTVSPDLLFWVTKPCHQSQTEFVFLSVPEAFYTTLTICGIFTWCFCLPLFWYQCWSFFVPGFTISERSKISTISSFFFILFIGSLGLTFFLLTPLLLHFLLKFQIEQPSFSIQYQATLATYISWISSCLLITFFVCQWPTLLYICILLKKITPETLAKYRKTMFLICVLLGAMISPPEIVFQLSFSFIFWVYTEFVLWFLFVLEYKKCEFTQNIENVKEKIVL